MIPALTEAEEEKLARQAVRRLGGSWCSLSQRRASKVFVGLADARVQLFCVAFWVELKSASGKLTRAQLDFLRAEYNCGEICFCGTAEDLTPLLQYICTQRHEYRGNALIAMGWATVQRVAARGFRGEKRSKGGNALVPAGGQGASVVVVDLRSTPTGVNTQ